ncbi:MAG TPA: ATP-binding protein [Hyphomicrobiaceae bacterium]|nr:ATP-binding protein [Hyphomicrobiaceae bacterium]
MTALTRLLLSTPFRLALIYMGAFILAAGLTVGFIAWRANELLTTSVVETLRAEVVGLREQYQAGGPARLSAIIAERAADPGSSLYLLVDSAGQRAAGNLRQVPPELRDGAQRGVFTYIPQSGPAQGKPRVAVGVLFDVPGGLTLVVGRDIEDLRRFAWSMGRLGLWSIIILSALGVGGGLLISRSVLRRIETVNDTTRTIMAGDLSRRIPLNGSGDELDRLAESLNAMLSRIEELMGALREVSDNIAHDLKTPLNRLRNRAEAALRSSEGAGIYRDGLVKTIEEADELIKTFNSLLLIARLEGGAIAESMERLNPASIIADIAELYEPVADEAGLSLSVAAEPGLTLTANRELVSQAVANLVDNAIKYSPDGGRVNGAAPASPISIVLKRVEQDIEIAVGDRGPGVAPEDRQRALQRFVRLEKSRSRPGSGLGLSLVAAVARLHGGSIRLEDNAPGLRAVLNLPVNGPNHAVPVHAGQLREH